MGQRAFWNVFPLIQENHSSKNWIWLKLLANVQYLVVVINKFSKNTAIFFLACRGIKEQWSATSAILASLFSALRAISFATECFLCCSFHCAWIIAHFSKCFEIRCTNSTNRMRSKTRKSFLRSWFPFIEQSKSE